MEMQGNATEIDERNLLQLDALLSHGYGLSPQLVMRSKGLSIEAKALYGYLSSFAGAGDTAFPSTSRILEELDISKNRFYKIRKELVSWGFISIETTATSAGLRTVYTLPQNPIAIKTEIDEIANRRNEIKSSLVANLHNEDMVSHKGDSESERLQQSAGNEPCRQSEAKAQNRGSNLKPCLQSEDEGCLQSGDKLYIDTNINPKVSIDRSAAHPSDDEGSSDWKVIEGMTDSTQRDDGESDRDANRRDALDAVPDGTYDSLPIERKIWPHDDEGNYYCSVRVYRLSYLAIDDQGTEYEITMEYIKSNEANPEEIGLNYVSIFKTDPDSDEIIRAGRTWE